MEGPVTHERLVTAIRRMDPVEVERCLSGGIRADEALDPQGHTVLDLFAIQQKHALKEAKDYRGRPEEIKARFTAAEQNAMEILKHLREAKPPAKFSSAMDAT